MIRNLLMGDFADSSNFKGVDYGVLSSANPTLIMPTASEGDGIFVMFKGVTTTKVSTSNSMPSTVPSSLNLSVNYVNSTTPNYYVRTAYWGKYSSANDYTFDGFLMDYAYEVLVIKKGVYFKTYSASASTSSALGIVFDRQAVGQEHVCFDFSDVIPTSTNTVNIKTDRDAYYCTPTLNSSYILGSLALSKNLGGVFHIACVNDDMTDADFFSNTSIGDMYTVNNNLISTSNSVVPKFPNLNVLYGSGYSDDFDFWRPYPYDNSDTITFNNPNNDITVAYTATDVYTGTHTVPTRLLVDNGTRVQFKFTPNVFDSTAAPAGSYTDNKTGATFNVGFATPFLRSFYNYTGTSELTFTVPYNMTVSVLCIGSAYRDTSALPMIYGGGGAIAYKNNIALTAGQTIAIKAGAGVPTASTPSYFKINGTVSVQAASGTVSAGGDASASVGTVKFSGGAPSSASYGGNCAKSNANAPVASSTYYGKGIAFTTLSGVPSGQCVATYATTSSDFGAGTQVSGTVVILFNGRTFTSTADGGFTF